MIIVQCAAYYVIIFIIYVIFIISNSFIEQTTIHQYVRFGAFV